MTLVRTVANLGGFLLLFIYLVGLINRGMEGTLHSRLSKSERAREVAAADVNVFEADTTTDRFAYAMIHYEGTADDDEYVLAVRVIIKSLRLTGTQHDIVILVSHNVRPLSIALFKEEGAIVVPVDDIPNPYEAAVDMRSSFNSRFTLTLNKLHLWNMLRYKRVVYMDADNVALHNMDELFLCGHFCAEFMNQVNFHTGLMVLKPDPAVFKDMLSKLGKIRAYDGADQGFLTAYFPHVESAPLFTGEPSEQPVNRLPFAYNLNHIFYYEKMSFNLQRGHGTRFENLTGHYYPVPAVSLAFPISPVGKPWHWLPYLFFDIHWEWQYVRTLVYERENWDVVFAGRLVFLAAAYFCMGWALKTLEEKRQPDPVATVRDTLAEWTKWGILRLQRFGPNIVSIIAGVYSSLVVGSLWAAAPPFVPSVMPPFRGWLLALIAHNLTVFWCLSIFALLTKHRLPHISVMTFTFCWQILLVFLLTRDIYDQFVNKIWMLALFIASSIFFDVNMFRSYAYSLAYRTGIRYDFGTVRKMSVHRDDSEL